MENSKVKICHIVSVDITLRFLLMPQLQFLKQQGYDVHAVCSPGTWKKDIQFYGITVKNITLTRRITPFRDFLALVQLFFYFKKEKFSIVHTHTPKPGLLGQLAARLAGVPVIINTVHGLYDSPDWPPLKRWFYTFIEKISARFSTLVFSQNKEDMGTMVQKHMVAVGKLAYLGNGVNLKRFNRTQFSEYDIARKKAELGIPVQAKVVGIVGRLVKEKGYLDLFEAFALVLKKDPHVLLLVIGPRDFTKKDAFSPDIVKKYGIEKNVIFLGEQANVEELYPLMDIFILPSQREGFPRTIIEAHAAGLPVIATNIRGCKEIITNGITGLLVDPKNPVAIAKALENLLENPKQAQQLAERGYKKALQEFNEDVVFERIHRAYRRFLPQTFLITGGAGFIGSHLHKALSAKGHTVVIIDAKAGLHTNDPAVAHIFQEKKPDVVFHCAGPIDLRRKETDPLYEKGLRTIEGTKKILEYCKEQNVGKIIFSSSGGAIYGNPDSAYAKGNLEIEKLIEGSGVPYAIVRLQNVYGPGQWASGVVPSFIQSMIDGKPPVLTGDGTQTRDFIYIDDAISALLGAARSQGSGIVDVISGKETSLNELLATIRGLWQNPEKASTSLQVGLKKTIASMRPIKTCHVTTVDITARFIILDFLKFLMRENYDVRLVCSFGRHQEFLEKAGIPIHHVFMTRRITPVEDIISFFKLYRYFKQEKFDIVHTYTPKAGVLGRIAARMAGVPIVIHTSYGFYIGEMLSWRIKICVMLGEKLAATFCDMVFSQNQEDIAWAIANNIINPKKIKLLHYGIDLKRFDPVKFSPAMIEMKKQELGIQGKKVIGMVGRFVKEKGYIDLFEAFVAIKKRIPSAALLLVAPKDMAKDDALDISILEKYGIKNDTVLLGYDQEIADTETVYPLMDVFVLPSYREGFPYSIMEASAMAKPVVATNIRGCKEAVENGVTGVLVSTASPADLARALISLLEDSGKAAAMGQAGHAKAVKDFNQNAMFEKTRQEYNHLMHRT
ncbi:MAG: glycosyltransferase [Candidatus Staskawiczbacteria bacterium]|nr:glycosyltransferase [Candidatus Staskawiczbacteria bacterium]